MRPGVAFDGTRIHLGRRRHSESQHSEQSGEHHEEAGYQAIYSEAVDAL